MASAVCFFSPDGILSAPEGWELQGFSPQRSEQRAQGLGSDGDEVAKQLYGGQSSGTLEYKLFATSGNIDFSTIKPGYVAAGWHVDSLSVSYSASDFPSVSVAVHKHEDCESGVTSHGTAHRTYAPSITLPAGFGCPAGLKSLLGVMDAGIGMSSFEYSMSVTHEDATGGAGAYLASENRDGNESISAEFVGIPDSVALEGWDETGHTQNRSNTAAETASYTLEHHVAKDANSAG